MAFIDTPAPEMATGALDEMYRTDTESRGYLPNYTRLFGHRPELYSAWRRLVSEVAAALGVRNYELATLAAARAMRSSYCALAHGKILADRVFDEATVMEIGRRGDADILTEAERAMMEFAAQVARDATGVSQADVDRLRSSGFDDAIIFDIASAAAARAFFSKMLDALGVEPDSAYLSLGDGLREALTVGRPIEGAGP